MKTTITLKLWAHIVFSWLILLAFTSQTKGQTPSTYAFSSTTGLYSAISGGTVLGTATNDDNNFNALPIGFTFTYNGSTFTTASVNANGFLALGATVVNSYTSLSTGTSNNVIAGLNADLQGHAAVGDLRYQTIGTSPNQVFVAQWTNYKRYGTANNLDSFNFQIRLNEGTNVIDFVYGRFAKNATAQTFQVGLRGTANTAFNNRTSTTSWVATTAGTLNSSTVTMTNTNFPPNGLTFTYTPPTPLAPTVATGSYANVTTTQATLNGSVGLISYPTVTSSGFVVSTSPTPVIGGFGVVDSATNPVVGSGAFSKTVTGLTLGTTYYYRAYAINSIGTTYGADSVFTTKSANVIPTVVKTAGTYVGAFNATTGGNITSDGGAPVTASGIVYATTSNPTLLGTGVVDSTTNPLVTSGTFTSQLGGLTQLTKYYYRLYATNSVGTAYSNVDSFTTTFGINTMPYLQNFDSASSPGWSSAIVTGTLNDWVIGTPAKTILNGAYSAPNAWVTKLTGNYSDNHNAAVVSPQFNFSTFTANPILRFKHKFISENNYDALVVEMSVNGGAWTKVDNNVGTSTNFNTALSTAWYNSTSTSGAQVAPPKFTGDPGSASYSSQANGWITSVTSLTGLAGQSDVKFRFRFGSESGGNREGWAIDDIEVFAPAAPTVITGKHTNVTTSSATLAGNISNDGGNTVTASGVVISTSPSPTRGAFGVIDSATNPLKTGGSFTVNVTDLFLATTYYYRAYAVNGVGTTYGADSTFTTNAAAVIPTVVKTTPTNVQAYSATLGGNITSDGGSAVYASGVVYSTTPNPALFGTGVVDSTTTPAVTTGLFSVNPAGLTHSTKYYYRAYATNAVGTAYSVQDSFITSPVISNLPYMQNFDSVGNTGWGSTTIGTGTDSWELGTPTKAIISAAYSAPKAWVTKLSGNYIGTEDCAVVSPQMDFSALTAAPILRFKHKFVTEATYDGGVVEISINNGTWTRVNNVTGTGTNFNTPLATAWYNNSLGYGSLGANLFSGNSNSYSSQTNGWIVSTVSLVGANGQSNVKVRFRFAADGITYDGWAIDDIEVFAPAAPTVATGTTTNITTASATLAGNITNNGGNVVTASGVVISTSPSPVRGGFGVIDSATNPLVTGGAFTVNVTDLFLATTYYYRAYAVNGVGTTYGADSMFTTNAAAVVPTVVRTTPINLQANSATLGGNITSDGGSAVYASGVVYSTTPNPALFGTGVVDSTTTPAVTSGLFSINPAGLTHSTKYYYRAYATNAVGTAYSVEDSFTTSPVVSNLPYMQNFDAAGNTGWSSTITTPSTLTSPVNNWVLGTPAKTFLNGAYSAPNAWVTKLTGFYDNYHDAAVVSPQFDFTTATASPILRFKHKFVTEAGYDGLAVEMSVNGGAWTKLDNTLGTGTNFNTALSTAWYNNPSANGPITPNKFSGNPGSSAYASQVNGWITSVTSLVGAAGQSDVKIRFRFGSDVSGNEDGYAIDDIEVFAPAAPSVATGTKTNITNAAVTLAGNITNDGGNTVTASGFVISTSPAPVRGGFGVIDSATNPLVTGGGFTKNVANLFAATTYYYRAYAVNGIGTSYGVDSSFTTNASAVIPTVVRVVASNVNATVATVGGNITSDGGSTVFASGVVYSTTPNPALFGTGVVDSTTSPAVTTGLFSVSPAGLTHSTKYYYRAYATNAIGTAYSVQDSFTTAPIISTLPYTQNFEGTGNTGWGSMLTSTDPTVNWIVGLATYNNWVLGTPAKTYLSGAKSGTKAWVTKTTGDYDTDHDASVVSPQFNFGALTSDPIVRFNHKFKCETEWDGLIVEVSINGGFWRRADSTVGTGGNFNSTTSYSWYNTNITNTGASSVAPYFSTDLGSASVYSSQTNGWIESAFKLTGAAGQSNVRFRFRFIADAYVTDEGWAIDDIEVVNVVTPTIAASNVTATPAATSANVSFTAGNGTGRMVVARLTSVLAVAPTNNTMYGASAVYGSTNTTGTGNYIVYMGNGTSVNVTGLTAATGYTFDVYEFNGKYMHINFASGINSGTTTTPVKLLSFTAEKQNADVRLSWITASEKNNAGFNVERSIDGKTFEVVNFVKGSNNASRTNYVSTDKSAFAVTGVNKLYYRLQQLDENGKFEYSTVVSVVNTEALIAEITVYPNPFNDKLTVTISDAKAGVATIEVMDLSGRLMYSVDQTIDNGNQTLTINELSTLSQGVYFVRISTLGNTKVVKMIKQ